MAASPVKPAQSLILLAVLAIVAMVGPLPALAQSSGLRTVTLLEPAPVDEGDSDRAAVVVHWRISAMGDTESRFTVETRVPASGTTATPGIDYEPIAPEEWVIPPHQTAGTIVVYFISDRIAEPDETLEVRLSGFHGLTAGEGVSELVVTVTIRNDDVGSAPPLVGNDDYVFFDMNSAGIELIPQENDIEDTGYFTGGSLVATSQPNHGALFVVDRSAHYQPDRWFYVPDPDFAGLDGFGYRICLPQAECVEATIHLQGQLTAAQAGGGYSGSKRVILSNLPAMDDVRPFASALAPVQKVSMQTTVDETPHLAWDSRAGMAWRAFTIPASPDGTPRQYRVYARYRDPALADLRVGRDLDGDGAPSADEEACFMRQGSSQQECEVELEVGAQPVTYWVSLHSREAVARQTSVDVAHAEMDVNGDELVSTGPAITQRLDTVLLRVAWKNLLALAEDESVGFVRLMDGGQQVGRFRFHAFGGGDQIFFPLNESVEVDVAASFGLHKMFVDIPGGATELSVTVESDKPLEVLLVRAGWINGSNSLPDSAPAPPGAGWVAIVPGQRRTLAVANPGLGRWYLAVRNGNQRARLGLRASVKAAAPDLRPGSYFNEFQPGSGLILYPAGDQLAGLWYTYSMDSGPTWYYLQAAKPGLDGVWRSPIYRTSWNGESARNVRVGEMQVTSVLPDWFFMTYEIDGFLGSQPMSALGRGCPSTGGQVVDISSHWFDPARAGTGYSVQTWPNYEFYAAFMYNRQGVPAFLAAEGPFVPSEDASFALETLSGNCPVCAYTQPPVRRAAGVLTRTLLDGNLHRIALDVDFEEHPPLGGQRAWSVIDQVVPLGGPGTTQGCAP